METARASEPVLVQRLAAVLQQISPVDWKRLWIEYEVIEEDVREAQVFCEPKVGDVHALNPGFERIDTIDQAMSALRTLMLDAGQPAWRTARFALEPSGAFKLTYGYDAA